jgi:hypothetical protein
MQNLSFCFKKNEKLKKKQIKNKIQNLGIPMKVVHSFYFYFYLFKFKKIGKMKKVKNWKRSK